MVKDGEGRREKRRRERESYAVAATFLASALITFIIGSALLFGVPAVRSIHRKYVLTRTPQAFVEKAIGLKLFGTVEPRDPFFRLPRKGDEAAIVMEVRNPEILRERLLESCVKAQRAADVPPPKFRSDRRNRTADEIRALEDAKAYRFDRIDGNGNAMILYLTEGKDPNLLYAVCPPED